MYHRKSIKEVYEHFGVSEQGLAPGKAAENLKEFGYNEIRQETKDTAIKIFLRQFTDLMVIILMAAAVISFVLGERVDAIVILVILIVNAIIGFIQEYKAEESLKALQSMISPQAKVMRGGVIQQIAVREIVPGDIILLSEGDKIPADARLVESNEMRVDEAVLTGESRPVLKIIDPISGEHLTPADQKNMVFMGTHVLSGTGKAIVTATGMLSEFGKIANLTLNIKEEKSPMQKELAQVGKYIAAFALVICAMVFVLGVLTGKGVLTMFIFAVALAVAAVPEGLPATITISLAIGVQRLVKKKAVMKKLSSVETLGCTTVICSDKTGTLTRNEMTVTEVFVNNKTVSVEGIGYNMLGNFVCGGEHYSDPELEMLLKIGVLCNNAFLNEGKIIGDPTEGSLLVSGKKYGLNKEVLYKHMKKVYEMPFNSKRKLMSTAHEYDKKIFVMTKGAPDEILKICSFIRINGRISRLTKADKDIILKKNTQMAEKALRVLGFAYKDVRRLDKKNVESDLVFVGLQGMIDPPRPEVKEAVALCHKAGIRIFVITGDFGITAKAVAMTVGIADEATKIITGAELSNMSDQELESAVEHPIIFARASPEHKMRIVTALMNKGEIVAVTGDGVNDAPALKKANIGVAMGITGTDVSKEASDMILQDDSFATIVHAVREGRQIYENIKKFMRYLFTCNMGELITVFAGLFFLGWFLPKEMVSEALIISTVQILWVNLATDVLPALALSVEFPEEDIMQKPPRDPKRKIINSYKLMKWLFTGVVIGFGTFVVYVMNSRDLMRASTLAFTTLVVFQLVNVFNCKSNYKSIFKIKNFWKNKFVFIAIGISLALQLMVIYVPFFRNIFNTVALTAYDWLVVFIVSMSVVLFEEIRKYCYNKSPYKAT